jgi:hypothetical protein
MNDQWYSFKRRRILGWLVLALSVTLAACSTGKTHYGRSASHVTGSDHRDGQSDRLNIIERRYSF